MTENGPSAQIFAPHLRALARARAERRMAGEGISFLQARALDDLAERLQDVNRRFESACLIGPVDCRDALLSRLLDAKHPKQFDYAENLEAAGRDTDLVISLLDLQSENDLPDYLAHMAQQLRPDGLLIAAMLGGETLTELRQALYKTDEALLGGLTARVYPMVIHSQAAPLLVRAGLNLPVVDMDRLTVRYGQLPKLWADLRDLGESNVLTARSKRYLGRDYPAALAQNYAALFGRDGKFPASFEILWLTGWAPHDSQPKPLKPGSAKMRLADALKTQETKL